MKIALLGFGTVGRGLFELLQEDEIRINDLVISRILRKHAEATDPLMCERIEDILGDPEIEVVVEAMGGLHPAYEYVKASLESGKHVISSNKALINAYGDELNSTARRYDCALLFSAACGGGIPFLSTIIEVKNQNRIEALGGILNGTTNFILDKMEREGLGFNDALSIAQAKGYAEADPSSDIDGIDTRNKIRLATAVGFDTWIQAESIPTEGIRNITSDDIDTLMKQGYRCRLMAGTKLGDQGLSVFVEPTLVKSDSRFAGILENNNLTWIQSNTQELEVLIGQGAGGRPTATNILRDLLALKSGQRNMLPKDLSHQCAQNQALKHRYLVRCPLELRSEWLESVSLRISENNQSRYYWTEVISVNRMHEEIYSLRKLGSCFFAGIQE